jgi:hypothetical protein
MYVQYAVEGNISSNQHINMQYHQRMYLDTLPASPVRPHILESPVVEPLHDTFTDTWMTTLFFHFSDQRRINFYYVEDLYYVQYFWVNRTGS